MTQYSEPAVIPMVSSLGEHLLLETPILMEALAFAVGTTAEDVAEHLSDTEGQPEQSALSSFIDEYLLTT